MAKRQIYLEEDPKSLISEAFRTLKTNFQYTNIDNTVKSVIVSSAHSGEGKSTVATNLAAFMALNERKVLIIDADLRKPQVHNFFHIKNLVGLSNAIMENDPTSYIQSTKIKNVDVLTSGKIPPNPAEMLGSQRFMDILYVLYNQYDLIILDAPPVNYVTDAAVLAGECDGVLLVTEVGSTEKRELRHAIGLLENVNAKVLGVVLNKIPLNKNSYYHYYYGKYYGREE